MHTNFGRCTVRRMHSSDGGIFCAGNVFSQGKKPKKTRARAILMILFLLQLTRMSTKPVSPTIDRLDLLKRPVILRAIALILSFCLLLLGVHVTSIVAAHRGQLQDTATNTANMARVLASHAERTIKMGEAVLGEMVERAEYERFDSKETARLHARLQAVADTTPEIQELFIYDREGRRIVTSLEATLPGSNADREFFRYHMQHADRRVHIGLPIRSRSSGVLTIPLSRRVNRADGSFGGVVMASLKLDFFGKFYDSLDVGQSGTIILALDDGTLLYRRPFVEALVGTSINTGPVFQLYRKKGPVGTAMLTAKIDNIERLYSYRHLEQYPLLVAIAQSKEEILSEWWQTFIRMSCLVAGAIAILVWGAQRMIRQLMVREALEDELRRARVITEQHNVALQALANTDSLTGLANRRHFEQTLATEYERSRRTGKPCSVILSDVDFFKKYNDHYGHVEGDACLRQVATAIAGSLRRPADLAARYGGEEFVVLLPETDLDGASAVAEHIRQRIAALALPHADSPLGHVTISLGVYTGAAGEGSDAGAWIKAADSFLYDAKAAGRNRYVAGAQARDGASVAP
jgi:diguanylate cyclase (GGDEF)-like protein